MTYPYPPPQGPQAYIPPPPPRPAGHRGFITGSIISGVLLLAAVFWHLAITSSAPYQACRSSLVSLFYSGECQGVHETATVATVLAIIFLVAGAGCLFGAWRTRW